jgi:hypothetical protein
MATASHGFTAERCEQLFQVAKTVVTRINWKAQNDNTLTFHAKVATLDGVGLDLRGVWQRVGRHGETRWGFFLLYKGHCVRQYDMAKKHHNPGIGWVRGQHKHRYSSSRIPRFAYKPDPPISDTELNQSLMDFLTEANIAIPANFQYVMFP